MELINCCQAASRTFDSSWRETKSAPIRKGMMSSCRTKQMGETRDKRTEQEEYSLQLSWKCLNSIFNY